MKPKHYYREPQGHKVLLPQTACCRPNPFLYCNTVQIAPCKGIQIPVKILPVESGILGFGIRNTAQVIQNSPNDWNPESKFH